MTTSTTIFWTASNNSNSMVGMRSAKSMASAVRAAREYVENELYGEGTITFCDSEKGQPIRKDEKGLRTNNKWETWKP